MNNANSTTEHQLSKQKLNSNGVDLDKEEEDFEVDYESLPSNFSFTAHMLAGAMAGITEHGFIYPVDSIKTRMQVLSDGSASSLGSSFRQIFKSVLSSEGIGSLWRGIGSMILGAGPSHALYFATYEEAKRFFAHNDTIKLHPLIGAAVSGAMATTVADAFMNPFDVVKQRMQIGYAALDTCAKSAKDCPPTVLPSPSCKISQQNSNVLRYRSLGHCFSHTLRTEGLTAFYVSYPTTLAMSIPFQSINFSTYEYMRALLHPLVSRWSFLITTSTPSGNLYSDSTATTPSDGNSNSHEISYQYDPHSYSPLTHVISGAIAGATAAFLTTPLDVSKTLLQTRTVSTCPRIRSATTMSQAWNIIYSREGLRGFWRGGSARVLGSMPAAGISWLTYEYFKWILQGKEFSEAKQLMKQQQHLYGSSPANPSTNSDNDKKSLEPVHQ